MSRHVIPNAPDSPDRRTTSVGWDAPLSTFFASVTDMVPDSGDPEYEDEIEVFAIGETPCELPTIGDLARGLAEHGVNLPVSVAEELAEDYRREGAKFAGRPATNLLAAMSTAYAGPEQAARIRAALTGQAGGSDA